MASPRSGSGCEVKNWNGVDAPHSSPWKSIGVNGPARVSSAAQASWSSSRCSVNRSPRARLPIWSWFWLQTTSRHVGIVSVSIGGSVVALAEGRVGPVVEEPLLAHLGESAHWLEVGVVAGGLPGQGHVYGVVEVVAPLRVQSEPARFPGRDQLRVVEVGLGDQRQRAADEGGQRGHLDRHLLQQVQVGAVGECVYGVDSQPVHVIVVEPHQRVVEDVAPYLGRAVTVQVDQRAPRVRALRLQVRPEQRQVVARRAEVVVDHVLDHAEPGGVAAVDEPLVRRGPAVLLRHRGPEHAVVAPVVGPVDRVDRHHLDEVDTDRTQVVELAQRGVEGAFGREGADVQLVDHAARKLTAGPRAVRPRETGGVERA